MIIIISDNACSWSTPRHYLNQCWNIVNLTLRNKSQWNVNRNSFIFIQENAFEKKVCESGVHVILALMCFWLTHCPLRTLPNVDLVIVLSSGRKPLLEFKSWWRHQMETFYALLAICAGNSPAPVNSPHKGQWRGALMFSLICSRINDWVNNREAGDLRRHLAHYDVTVMLTPFYVAIVRH